MYGGTHTVYWFALLHGSLRSAPLCSAAAFVTFVTASATLLLFVREFYDLHWINESAPSGRHHSRLRRIPKFSSIRDVRGRLPCAHNTVESVSWCDRTDDDDDDDAAAVYVRSLLDLFCVSLNSGFLRKKPVLVKIHHTPARALTLEPMMMIPSFFYVCLPAG